jgi:hypothetical protein
MLSLPSIVQLLNNLNYNSMILILLQTADDYHSNYTLNTSDPDWYPATMYSILPGLISETKFVSESSLIPIELAVHVPSRATPSQHGFPFACHPNVIIRHHTRVCACMEEGLVLICERDVDHDWCWDGKQAIAQRRAKFPCIICCEMLEYQRGVDSGY